MILGTSVALPTQTRWSLARLGFIIAQHVIRVLPLWILVHQIALLVEYVRPVGRGIRIRIRIFQRLYLLDVVNGRAQIMIAVRKSAMRPILYTEPTRIGVMHAHTRLVIT